MTKQHTIDQVKECHFCNKPCSKRFAIFLSQKLRMRRVCSKCWKQKVLPQEE